MYFDRKRPVVPFYMINFFIAWLNYLWTVWPMTLTLEFAIFSCREIVLFYSTMINVQEYSKSQIMEVHQAFLWFQILLKKVDHFAVNICNGACLRTIFQGNIECCLQKWSIFLKPQTRNFSIKLAWKCCNCCCMTITGI